MNKNPVIMFNCKEREREREEYSIQSDSFFIKII